MINQSLATPARALRDAALVPANVKQERLTGFDANGNVVFGPSTVTKAAVLTFTVPLSMTSFRIDYLDVSNAVVGITTSNVTLFAGVTVTLSNLTVTPPPGAPSKLAFSVQPSNALSGQPMTPPVQVQLLDGGGNVAATSNAMITLALGNNPTAATLGGTLSRPAVNGVATFSDLSVDTAGTGYTLTAASTDLAGATSSAFDVAMVGPVLPPSQIKISTPANVQSGIGFSVTVTLLDINNKVVSNANNAVTLSIANDPSGKATLGGTTTQNAAGGVAMFSGITIDKIGKNFVLSANCANLPAANTQLFKVTAGTISFAAPKFTLVDGGSGPSQNSSSFALGDFNQDGNLDVAVLCSNTGDNMRMSILYGQGDGTFKETQFNDFYLQTSPLDFPASIVVGKFSKTNPNFPDIAFATGNFLGGELVLMANNGDGSFTVSTTKFAKNGYSNKGLAVLDINNDGALDIAATDEGNLGVQIFVNDGTGKFTPQFYPAFIGPQYQTLWAADFDGDGNVDLVTSFFGDRSTMFMFNNGVDKMYFDNMHLLRASTSANRSSAIGDLNGDGKIDYVLCENNNRKGDVYINNGDRTFTVLPSITVGGINPQGCALADIDQDGVPDIVFADQDPPAGFAPAPPSTTGGFEVWRTVPGATPTWPSSVFTVATPVDAGGTPTGTSICGVLSGDFNNDGVPDIILLGDSSKVGGVTVFLNTSH